jgi:hypothetical protein
MIPLPLFLAGSSLLTALHPAAADAERIGGAAKLSDGKHDIDIVNRGPGAVAVGAIIFR